MSAPQKQGGGVQAAVSIEAARREAWHVDLWGHAFEVKRITRSVKREYQQLLEQLDETADDEQLLAQIGQLLDLRLKPSDGKRTDASVLLARKWEAEELDEHQLLTFFRDFRDADRPT